MMRNQSAWIQFNTLCIFLFIGIVISPAMAKYQSQAGRWMQQDPMQYVDGLNLYEYVRSNPVLHCDPKGRSVTYHAVENLDEKKINFWNTKRGQVSPVKEDFKWACVPCIGMLKLFYEGEYVLRLLRADHKLWNDRAAQYDKKWGAPRDNATERQATLSHERDHLYTHRDYWNELDRATDPFDGMVYGSQILCKWVGTCVEKVSRRYLTQSRAHSKRFDNTNEIELMQGGMYGAAPYTTVMDFSECMVLGF